MKKFFLIKQLEIECLDKNIRKQVVLFFKDKNLLFFSPQKTEKEIIKRYPLIKKVFFQKKLPDKLMLKIELEKPLAVLKTNGGYLFLNEEGKIIIKKKGFDNNYPLINFYQQIDYSSFNLGKKIDFKDVLASLFFLKKIKDLGLKINQVEIKDLNMIVLKLREKEIIISAEKKKEVEVYQLLTILRYFKIEGKEFKVLDLRFDKPIIKF
ncbi:MAG: hypothetical protein N2482_02105 [Patescibacteria group bacterium]|nr:hypothetical protein [Patescibacteria group bacterium]